MKTSTTSTAAAVVSLLAVSVAAHGNITSPAARLTGPAMVAACGQAAVDAVLKDGTIPLEDVTSPLPSCQLDLCRGAMFEDNQDLVQTFQPGQVINMTAQLPIGHAGPMNVSIVSTANNSILSAGANLIEFAIYADETLPAFPPNNTAFSVTMPVELDANACTVAGDCVLQWFWFGTNAKQTYESCVDFVLVSADQVL
ncbi:Chitin-binding, domain 3 [Niveomyces insectorum RCEF 264]|uniref:Chitin-binding, domain 3 n=1 Tax=Niveomyces insectorum RCEF 264 TaxID=1081102 RepID=A0A167Y0U8_9HYPO|nr:Chitin-binding, domain 3 [Niveomyces insectorum RCEF 264]